MTDIAHWKAKPHRADYDEMRAKILDAAWDEAADAGVQKLTLNSVARRADCARSSVYRYFDSKEQLLSEALRERILNFGRDLKDELDLLPDPADQLVRGAYLTAIAVKASPALSLFRFLEQYEGLRLAELTLESVPTFAATFLELNPLFETARREGAIRKEVSNEEIMRWLVMVVLSLTLLPDTGTNAEQEQAYLRKMLTPSIFNP